MNKSAREVALNTLLRVLTKNAYSNISLNNSLKNFSLSVKDRNFVTQLVYGTIQYQLYLEYQLQGLLKTKVKEVYIKPLLLMSLYQIIFLDKVPNHAVVNEANVLAKKLGGKHSASYKIVNGVLRAFLRRGSILPDVRQPSQYLSVKYSVPRWLVDYFIENWGVERAQKILASINQPAKNAVRLAKKNSTTKIKQELIAAGFAPQKSVLNNQELILKRGGISETSFFKKGQLTIQDEAASLAVASFEFSGDEEVLDACSAPGGKTVQIAEQLTTGQVTALDIHKKKLRLVKQNAERMQVDDRVKTKALDARKAGEVFNQKQFDKILVDAPCSGLGLLRRKPEIRYTKKLTDLTELSKIQLAILGSTSELLKNSGELVYATCSIAIQEDEAVVEQFLQQYPNFKLTAFKAENLSSDTGMLKILPDSYGSDGFFIAKFKRRG